MAARPTPFASCISLIIRSTSRVEVLVELLDLARRHPQRRIGVLADLRERRLAQRLALRVELLVSDLSCLLAFGVNV